VVANLEVCHDAKEDNEDEDEGRVAEPEQVIEALCVAGGLLHPALDLVLLSLDETRLGLKKRRDCNKSLTTVSIICQWLAWFTYSCQSLSIACND